MALWTCNPLIEVIMVIAIFTIYTKGHKFLISWLKETVWKQILYHEAIAVSGDILLLPFFLYLDTLRKQLAITTVTWYDYRPVLGNKSHLKLVIL